MRRAACPGGRGVRRFRGRVRVPRGQGHAPDPRLGEGGPRDRGRGRARGARARTARVRFLRGRDDSRARQPGRPGLHGRTAEREVAGGHRPGSGPGTGRACLSPPVDCHDGRIAAHTAGFDPDAELANRMSEEAVATPPGACVPWCIPTAAAITGGPDGWTSWNGTA